MKPDFEKLNGLLPVIVQDVSTRKVLMLGFMNEEAFEKTKSDGKVTFFSRTKDRLWTKGETSGNFLIVKDSKLDCDSDTLLIQAEPVGPVCHTGTDTCFSDENATGIEFLGVLEEIIADRKNKPEESSYTSSLFAKGLNKIAQKVGEEATEVVIASVAEGQEAFLSESADLLFHFMVLLQEKGSSLKDVVKVLRQRNIVK